MNEDDVQYMLEAVGQEDNGYFETLEEAIEAANEIINNPPEDFLMQWPGREYGVDQVTIWASVPFTIVDRQREVVIL